MHPLGYAVKAFELGSHGAVVPVAITNADGVNLTAYSVLSATNSLYVTIINKEHDTGARSAKVTVIADSSHTKGRVMFLAAPNGDVAVTKGVTLGGAGIHDNGTWHIQNTMKLIHVGVRVSPAPLNACTSTIPHA